MSKNKTFKRDMSKDIDVAIAEKRAYDFLVRSQEAKQYIEDMIQEKLPGGSGDFVSTLRDGQYLCRLANVFTNNSIKKIHQIKSGSLLEFMATDNLNNFFKACKAIKFGEHNFFTIPDIWEKKNIVKVIACVHALAHYISKHQIAKVKIKDLSKVGLKFDEEEIKNTKELLEKLDDDPSSKPMIAPPSRHELDDNDEIGDDEGTEDLELADPDECLVEGEGISKAQAGETATAKITAKDNLGNVIEVGGEEFSAMLFNKNDKKIKYAGKVVDNDDGTYTIAYTPLIAGDYALEVYLHDIQDDDENEDFEKMLLKGCPFQVKVLGAKKSDPTKCTYDGIGSTNSTAGTESTFTLQSFDEFGNFGIGDEDYKVTLTNGEGEVVSTTVKHLGNGLYEVTYIAPKSGEYDLKISLGDKVFGKDQKVSVKDAGISEPDTTFIEGISIEDVNVMVAGGEFKFTIVGKDKHGNVRESGGEKFTATLISTTMGNKHALHLTKILEDPKDETIEKLFKKFDKDSNQYIDRKEFSEFVREVTSYVDSKKSQSILEFDAFDKNDDNLISLEEFTSHMKKLDDLQVIRTALGEKHSIALNQIIGSDSKDLFVKYDKDSNGFIDREEFKLFVTDVTNLAQSQSILNFDFYDKNKDNQISLDEFSSAIQKLAQEQLSSSTIGNKYALALNTLLGDSKDENVKNLFTKYDVNGDGFIDREEFDAFVKEVTDIVQNLLSTSEDKSSGLLNFDAYSKKNESEITLEEFVSHLSTLDKEQTISSMLGNKSAVALSNILQGTEGIQKLFSKYDKNQSGTVDRNEFVGFVNDVLDYAEQESLLTFEAYDKNKDDSISLVEFTDHIQKLAKEQLFTSVGSKYALALNTLLGGPEYEVNIKRLFKRFDTNGDSLINKEEFKSFVQAVKDLVEDEPAILSREKYEEYTKRKEIAQSLLSFESYDTNQDNKISLPEFKEHIQKLASQQPKRSEEVSIVDLQNGRYQGNAFLRGAGDYEINVKLDGKPIGQPIKIHVNPIEKTETKSCTYRTKADLKQIKAGAKTVFIVETRDEFGNLRSQGGENFTTRLTSKTKKEILEDKVQVKDLNNGTYEVSFDLEEVGEYALEVLLGDDYINGFPIENILIKESGVTDPKRNVVDGEGLHDGTSKKPGQFTIATYDQFGNARTTGGDKITAKFVNKQRNISFGAEVTDLDDGSYEVNYLHEVPVDTEFEVEVIHNGVNIFADKPQTLKLKGLKIKEIAEDQLLVIQDHDLLNSLLNLFKEEESESYITKIQELREKLISQIKKNFDLEANIKHIEKKIELLINNRIKAEEINSGSKKKKQDTGNSSVVQENDTKNYSHLFYLLQTQPKYLSTCLYLVPPEKVETFLETVILTLYGYAFSAREEYLILNLFKQALQLEVEKDTKKIGSFLNNNPVLPKMVMTYGRRLQGKTYLQKVLFDKIIEPILKIKNLDLELNAVKLLKTYLSDQEVETGVKNTEIDVKNLSYERAMKEEHIATKINERLEKLSEICSGVLQGMSDYVDEMPYGLRYVCKQLDRMLLEKHEKSTESERASVIGYIVYYRFMNPALVSPDGFELTKNPIKPVMRTNLILISKVMTNLSNNARFDKKLEEHMTLMNDWLEKNESPYVDFIRKLTNVADPEDSLGVDEYMELTQKTNPTITIKWNEIFLTHGVLLKYLHKLATEKDDPLKIILSEPGMDKAPEELTKEQDEEIKLPLINRFAEKTTEKSATADQLYDAAKESFRTILKSLPSDQIGTSVKNTLVVAKKYAEKVSDKVILSAVNQIETVLPTLIENGKVQEKTEYREIIVDITREIQSAKILIVKQKKEHERLKDSLASLEGHQKFLESKMNDFDEYINNSMINDFIPSGGAKQTKSKSHAFTYAQLEKKGVIRDMTVMKSQRNRVKFNISMDTPGLFKVDAKVGGITVKTIDIKLEELLAMKARGSDKLDYEYVILDVNMTLHVMNKLFMQKK
jgi:Ras GTPase-activating-like protein IQGAP2/3